MIRTVILWMLAVITAFGFSPATPHRHVITSDDNICIFVMDPGDFESIHAKGVAYLPERDGFKKLWEVEGWYSRPNEIFLPDGMTLVRVRTEIVSAAPSKPVELGNEEILFLYVKGDLKRSYKLKDLVPDVINGTRMNPIGMGLLWMKKAEVAANEHGFEVTFLDGTTCVMDLQDGDLLSKKISGKNPQKQNVPAQFDTSAEHAVPSDGDKPQK